MTGLRVAPIKLRQANEYIERVHRHHGATRGMQFAVAVVDEHGEIRGVGVAGRPVSRIRQAEGYLEVTRVATDGAKNACSMIYGALARAGQALGYPRHRIQTYILESETGASLRAAGWVNDGTAGGGSWSRAGRAREDRAPIESKVRYLAGRESSDSKTAWRDRHGDVWRLGEDGLLHTPETAPFSREHVERKWGPLVPESSVSERSTP